MLYLSHLEMNRIHRATLLIMELMRKLLLVKNKSGKQLISVNTMQPMSQWSEEVRIREERKGSGQKFGLFLRVADFLRCNDFGILQQEFPIRNLFETIRGFHNETNN